MKRNLTETRLRRAFADVLVAVLATTTATGCGGEQEETGPGGGGAGVTPSFTSACPSGEDLFATPHSGLVSNMRATPELDGVVNRIEGAFPLETAEKLSGTSDAWTARNGISVGALCTKASNPDACNAKVASFRILPTDRAACNAAYQMSSAFNDLSCSASYILYTRGDEVGFAQTDEQVRALIGTVDTLEEASWMAAQQGLTRVCGAGVADQPPSEYRTTADGGYDLRLYTHACGQEIYKILVHVDPAGNVVEISREDLQKKSSCPISGRRPDGICLDAFSNDENANANASTNAVGQHFANMATLEAASVIAFRRLHRQLASLGAPQDLLDRIEKAAQDEVRHARATAKIATKYGVKPSLPNVASPGGSADSALFAIALENAREGCVRETYGALLAHLQMTRARDADVRACMSAIADEETEHAALSWDIAAWIEPQLPEEERARLATERRDAFTTLARELAEPIDLLVRHVSGVPACDEALRMLQGLAPVMLAAVA